MKKYIEKIKSISWRVSILLLLLSFQKIEAQITVSTMFSDNMVLQRNKKVPIWGTAIVGEKITVKFLKQSKSTTTDKNGNWKVYLEPLEVNTQGNSLEIKGDNLLVFKNILVGDVWLATGQSNMKYGISGMGAIKKEILALANNNSIRFFNVPRNSSSTPQTAIDTQWEVSSKSNIGPMSAIGYIFAQKIQVNLNIPIGIINTSLGSTSVSCWVPDEISKSPPFAVSNKYWYDLEANWEKTGYKMYLNKAIEKYNQKPKGKVPTKENLLHISKSRTFPSGAYNAMLHPIFPFAVKGAIWRQGEANSTRAVQYQKLLPLMIEYWRTNFEDEKLPFIEIGLPAYGKVDKINVTIAELRESQIKIALNDKNTYFVSIIDLVDLSQNKGNIHPKNKYLAGERTANLVLNKIYKQNINTDAPTYKSKKVSKNKIVLSFKNTGSGFYTGTLKDLRGLQIEKTNAGINNFWIAGENGKFEKASAQIIGKNQIEVWSDEIDHPIEVRYAWIDLNLNINLYAGNGIPLNTFRTDHWDLTTKGNVKPKINIVNP